MTQDEKNYVMWMHISGLSSYIGVPFGHFLVPLVLWLLKRKESSVVDQQGKEILNFQLTITFYLIFSYILVFILIGFLFIGVVILLHIIAAIVAAVRAHEGVMFRYPVTFRVIR